MLIYEMLKDILYFFVFLIDLGFKIRIKILYKNKTKKSKNAFKQ